MVLFEQAVPLTCSLQSHMNVGHGALQDRALSGRGECGADDGILMANYRTRLTLAGESAPHYTYSGTLQHVTE